MARREDITIVYVGDPNPYARSQARARAFAALGARVIQVAHTLPGDPKTGTPRLSLIQKIAGKLLGPLDWAGAGRNLLATLKTTRPDIIWVDKAMAVRPEALARAKALAPNVPLVWFSEDDMFAPHNRSARFDAGLPLYDVVFTTKAYNAEPDELSALGARTVHFLFQAYDPTQHYPVELTAEDRRVFGGDIGFVGSFELNRARSMLALAEAGMAVRVWGNLWERCPFAHPNLQIQHRALVNMPGDLAYAKGIAATRINLCFLRKANRDQHTSRTFEIPAIGGFMLGERTAEHQALFREGIEAAFFASDAELVDRARYYLDHEAERAAVAAAGHARCVAEYSSAAQAETMLDIVLGN